MGEKLTNILDEGNWSDALYRILALSVMAVGLGFVVSLAAIAFVDGVVLLNQYLFISPRTRVQYESQPMLLIAATLLVPTLGGILVGLLFTTLSRQGRPLGPPDVVRSAQLRTEMPDVRSGIVSTFAAMLSLGVGASVGQYGPIVYLGGMLGSIAAKLHVRISEFPVIALACGVAAAISTAFNAPIAGLVFAHEVILRHYSMQAFAPTTVASATGYVVANVMFDRPALFLVSFSGVRHEYEFLLFAGLGIISAGIAIGFMHLILKSTSIANNLPIHRSLRTGAAGFAVGLTALWLPDVLGIGTHVLRFATIEHAFLPYELPLLIVAKILLTALCVGFGFAGGVFSPMLLIGILSGAFYWVCLSWIGLTETSGVVPYAICGMMAATSPVIGAPLTVILIVFELTRNYDLTVAAMVAVVFSNLVSSRIVGRSLFDIQLRRQGVDLSAGRDLARLEAVLAIKYATQRFPRGKACESGRVVLRRLHKSSWSEIFICDSDNRLIGMISAVDAHEHEDQSASELCRWPELVFDETTTIFAAMESLKDFVGDGIPIVRKESGELIGVVTESALIQAYLDQVHALRREENATV